MKKKRSLLFLLMLAAFALLACKPAMSVCAAEASWMWPVPGSEKINQEWSTAHGGIDIGGSLGCDVVAGKSGTVYKVLKNGVEFANWGGYGNGVIINHGNGVYSHYAHLNSTCVSEGQAVYQGQKIGTMGTTGNSTGVHLHFSIKTGSQAPYGGPGGSVNNNKGVIAYIGLPSGSSSGSSISWSTSVSDITNTNAVVRATIKVPSSVSFQWAGCNFYDMKGNMIAQAGETTSVSGTCLNIWYNISNETWNHISLTPGTTYRYQFYATYGSVDHFSPMYTFTTTGTPPHVHKYTSSVTRKPTCQKAGIRTYKCSCGKSYAKTIAKLKHTVVTDRAVAATCEKDGKTAGSHCKVCKTVIKKQTVVKKLGHSWKKTVIKKATVFKNGTMKYTCTRCKRTKTGVIKKLTPVIKLSSSSVTLKKGKSTTVKVVKMAYGDSVQSWSSANKKVASVSKTGKITAVKKGTITITVKLKSGKKATVKVKVY